MSGDWKSIGTGFPGKVVQICYLVPDVEEAVERWTRRTLAGPFFHAQFDLAGQKFGAVAASGTLNVAVGYQQDMNIELAAYSGDGPAIYQAGSGGVEFGLHHIQVACDDIDAACRAHQDRGETVLTDHVVPGFGRAVMVDTRELTGHFTEYGAWTPAVHHALDEMLTLHRSWDGRDPFRPYSSLLG